MSLAAFAASPGQSGGICFRADDNYNVKMWRDYMAVFDKYGFKFSASVNLASVTPGSEYAAMLRQMQDNGFEMMDHTPSHNLSYVVFSSAEEAGKYAGRPGSQPFERS